MNQSAQIAQWSARLKAFGLLIKLGNQLFEAPDFSTACAMAVNSSHSLMQFKSAALAEVSGNHVKILAEYGATKINEHSESAMMHRALLERLERPEAVTVLHQSELKELDPDAAALAVEMLESPEDTLMIRELPYPQFLGNPGYKLVWLVAFGGEIPAFANSMAGILEHTFGEALYCHRNCRVSAGRIKKHFSFRKIALLTLIVVTAILMFVPVRESVNSEFTLKAPKIVSAYAWFDGPIARCLKQDGAPVKKGEVVAVYDASQLQFRLANAKNQLAEIEKEYELASNASFVDKTKLGQVKLIEARLDGVKAAVREAEWYLAHSAIKAPADGVLALADGRAEALENKAVRTGDRIFDVYSGQGVVAEIRVDEKSSSILSDIQAGTLYLYTSPDVGLPIKIKDIRKYPELTEQHTYAYTVLAEIVGATPENMRYGMRGIAKLYGPQVALGYYLFKSVVIYFRWL